MDIAEIAKLIGGGGGLALLFQMSKGTWNPWLTKLVALATTFFPGLFFGEAGAAAGLITSVSAFATHNAFLADTRLGNAIQLQLLPKGLSLLSELALNLAKAIENKPNP